MMFMMFIERIFRILKYHPPPLLIGVLGLLFLKAPIFYSGLKTWNEQVRSS